MIDLQDANNLLEIGEGSGLGTEALIATHLALSTEVIVFRKVVIGDNSHIQARACIAPGVGIGDNSIVGFGTLISLNVKIGNNTKIGGNSQLHTSSKVGNHCKIGSNVVIKEGVNVPDGFTIPDFTIVTKEYFNPHSIRKDILQEV